MMIVHQTLFVSIDKRHIVYRGIHASLAGEGVGRT